MLDFAADAFPNGCLHTGDNNAKTRLLLTASGLQR